MLIEVRNRLLVEFGSRYRFIVCPINKAYRGADIPAGGGLCVNPNGLALEKGHQVEHHSDRCEVLERGQGNRRTARA